MANVWRSIRVTIVFAVLLGLIYPLVLGLIGNLLFPYQAQGSMERQNGKIVGSKLIAQSFTSPRYFHSRPSAVDYAANASGGSNLGPTNPNLIREVQKNIALVKKENGISDQGAIPADMVETSASGLDPHISVANAKLQIPRVARATGLSTDELNKLIDQETDGPFLGIWGDSGVNVLEMNLAIDKKTKE